MNEELVVVIAIKVGLDS